MKLLKVDLANCHGIRHLTATIDFNAGNAAAIYAPNGTMKTSFARTFRDLSEGRDSRDNMFPARETTREITDETGSEVPPDDVVVILSYDEEVGPTEATSTLLVNAELRKEYEQLQEGVLDAADELLSVLKKQAKTRRDVARAISTTFTSDEDSFFTALVRIREELAEQEDAPFAEIPYDIVFHDKVLALLQREDFASALAEYVGRFNELLDASTFFSRHTFNYYNAANVTKSLADNGFFDASHSVTLRGAGDHSEEIANAKQLLALVEAEKQQISEDEELRKKFVVLEKELTKNIDTRAFYDYISDHVELLPELLNVGRFEERVWKSYLKVHHSAYEVVVDRYRDSEKRKREIEKVAAEQSTQWEEVIGIFNDRFFVPFTLTAKNRERVVLGLEKVLQLGFEFEDGGERASVEKGELLEVLSTGEKKALYILNVLFEVQARRNSGRETVFVIDDIADSFDYKNKYAIIQYLKEMSETADFRMVILTHNFDFYRTLESRFVPYKQCLTVSKSSEEVTLEQASGIRNPFVKDFRPNFHSDPAKRVASIPFLRNLLEYTRGDSDPGYLLLTSLLHWKEETAALKNSELDAVFTALTGESGAWAQPDAPVVDLIHAQADAASQSATNVGFAGKIVLSISIRLKSEQYMVQEIADLEKVRAITSNQTQELFLMYKAQFPDKTAEVRVLDNVVLMTPENIHVNSFMYEPIVDMSDDHLKQLYREVAGFAGTS